MGVARDMLHDQGFLLHLWVEACNTAIYLQNRNTHRILGMITPEEDFSRRKTDVSHFLIFEAISYCHVSQDSMKKFEPTSNMEVFIGYIKTPHNYRVYFPSLRVTLMRRDFRFDQEKAMRCSLKQFLSIPSEEELLYPKQEPPTKLRDLWSSHKQRSRQEVEWRHPLNQNLPKRGGREAKKLTNWYRIHESMWELQHLSTGRGGHQTGTLDICIS